jgi:hypothetical protein
MRPAWVKRQIESLIAQFAKPPAIIAVADRDMLAPKAVFMSTGTGSRLWRQGGGYLAVNDPALKGGFVWGPDGVGEKELWMPPEQADYRAAFEHFAKRYLGASGLAAANVQIDHVFPKKAAIRDRLKFVRMLAIPPESNMAAGRTVERYMAAAAALRPRDKRMRSATFYTIGKATGFAGYTALPDSDSAAGNTAIVGALFKYLRSYGLPPAILTELDAMLTASTFQTNR